MDQKFQAKKTCKKIVPPIKNGKINQKEDITWRYCLNFTTLQNGQTHANNSSTVADELFECDHFVGLALKGLMDQSGLARKNIGQRILFSLRLLKSR